ncbi:hypothetical protein [Terrisporobacter petrolearius]|uniref:hypothetical protein n=1 Tax=Terrisporobacter petrolearius TaxID=1460447 RepID=UPI003B0082D6
MTFDYAKVTKSRLMGSMGLTIKYENKDNNIYQYFLLDGEGLGIADYVSLKNPTSKEACNEEERLMGGLGDSRILVKEEVALFLINHFGNKNLEYGKELPGDTEEYIDIITKYKSNLTLEEVYPIISKKVDNEVEFINYMTMRFIARDRESLKYFSGSEEISNNHITKINGALLKNKVTKRNEEVYISEALYEDEDGYYTCKIAFNICKEKDNFRIKSLLVTDTEPIYDFEVFDEISKSEFIDIYKVKNKDEFLMEFYNDNPFMLKSEMEEGVFFTRFNFNNNHVKKDIYVINNDIKSIYYQLGDKFFVGTYSERDRKYINKLLMTKYKEYLKVDESYFFEENVLYDFVESGSDDFEDFLD